MKFLTILLSSLVISSASAQNIEWSENYNLKKEDFQATAPNIGEEQTIYVGSMISYEFSGYKALFSNLNSVVSCIFLPKSSWLDEGTLSQELLRYAQSIWNLNEIAARKLRKAFNENKAKLNATKAKALFDQVSAENTELQSLYSKETDFGKNTEKQKEWKEKIKSILMEYSDFCKTCSSKKKRKRTKKPKH